MEETSLAIPLADVRRLLGAASGDAALVYLYLRTGAAPAGAGEALRLPAHRVDGAMAASLRSIPRPTSCGPPSGGRTSACWWARPSGGWGASSPRRS